MAHTGIDLGSSRTVTLRVRRVRFTLSLLILLLCVACDGTPESPREASLILITLDTTRADALGCYGGPEGLAPNLDRLARTGIRFEQARTVTPVTLPSHATVLTGRHPFEHGVRDNAAFRLPGKSITLAEHLERAGYDTLAVMGAFVLHSNFGLNQGFGIYSDVPRRRLNLGPTEDQRTAGEVVDEALRLLDHTDGDKPIFLWVHFFDPHFPYAPPAEYLKRAREAIGPGRDTRARYLGEVAYMDHEIGRLLDGVRDAVPGGNLLTVVAADHGEGLGEHGEETHGFGIHDTTIRVPFIIHHESLTPRSVSDPVSLTDLAPTAASLLGFPFHEATGADWSPLIEAGAEAPENRLVYFEACHPFYNYRWSPLYGIVEKRLKLIDGPHPELYDVVRDPAETADLLADDVTHGEGFDPRAAARALRDRFAPLAERTTVPERIELTAHDRERIRNLGYAGVSNPEALKVRLPPGYLEEGLKDPAEGLALNRELTQIRRMALGEDRSTIQRAADRALELLRKDPDNPTFQAHTGSLLFRAERYGQAITVLRDSLRRLESATTRETLASAYFNLGRIDEAIHLLEINSRLHPYDLLTRFKLGDALLKKGRAQEALEHLGFFLNQHHGRDELRNRAKALHQEARRIVGKK